MLCVKSSHYWCWVQAAAQVLSKHPLCLFCPAAGLGFFMGPGGSGEGVRSFLFLIMLGPETIWTRPLRRAQRLQLDQLTTPSCTQINYVVDCKKQVFLLTTSHYYIHVSKWICALYDTVSLPKMVPFLDAPPENSLARSSRRRSRA